MKKFSEIDDIFVMARYVLVGCIVLGILVMVAMVATVYTWMTVPDKIVYQESSSTRTEVYSVEVQEHGQSHFLTPAQKQRLDGVRDGTPVTMSAGFAAAFLAIVVGAVARFRIPGQGSRNPREY